MRINKKKKPRKFLINKKIQLKDMGNILLKMITFIHGKNQSTIKIGVFMQHPQNSDLKMIFLLI